MQRQMDELKLELNGKIKYLSVEKARLRDKEELLLMM
jgi:hypothetical protein